MTVSTTNNIAGPFYGNDVATAFPFTDIKVLQNSDLYVYHTDDDDITVLLVEGVGYSLALNADQDVAPGGTITYPLSGSPLATGEKLTGQRVLELLQDMDLTNQGNYNPEVVEVSADKSIMIMQQNKELLSRSMKIPVSDDVSSIDDIPPVELRKNLFLGFDSLGNPIAATPSNAPVSAFMATVLDDDNAFKATSTLKTDYVVADKAEAVALTLVSGDAGRKILVTSEDGGHFIVRYNVTPGTYADNSVLYMGTQVISTGGDGTIGIERADLNIISVKHFGAKGGGIIDDTTAISEADVYAASISNQPVVYFPPDDYLITAITKTAKWVSDNVRLGTRIIWGGTDDGGVAIDATGENGSFGGFRNISLYSTGDQPTTWIDTPALIDKFYEMNNIHLSGTRGVPIVMYSWVNCHWYDIRFDNPGGYAIEATPILSQSLSTFVISGFTYDHNIASSTCEGMIHIDNSIGATNLGIMLIENGRIEVNQTWAGKKAIIVQTLPNSSTPTRSLGFMLSNVTYADSSGMVGDSVLYRDTTNVTSQEMLITNNVRLSSMSNVLGGTWPSTQYFPVVSSTANNDHINIGEQNITAFLLRIRIPTVAAAFNIGTSQEANDRFSILSSGDHEWGNGASGRDTTLKRYGAGTLRCSTGKFLADGGLGAGNSVANINTPVGATAYDLGIYDETGVLLGYIPIYAARW